MGKLAGKVNSGTQYQPGTGQVPAKKVTRVLRVFGGNTGSSFADYSTLRLGRWAYEMIVFSGKMVGKGLVGDAFSHGQRRAAGEGWQVTS